MHKSKILNKDFSCLILAQVLSKISDRILIVGLSWYIIKAFNSHALANFFTITMLPYIVAVLFSAYIINKFTAVTVIKYSEFSRSIIYLLFSGLLFLNINQIFTLLVICVLFANICTAIFNPALLMAPKEIFEDIHVLEKCLGSLNSCDSISRLFGPIIAVPIYELFKIRGLVLVCGTFYFLAWLCELMITSKNTKLSDARANEVRWLKSPFTILKKYKLIMVLLVTFLFTNLFVVPIQLFLPILSSNIYHGGVGLLSFFEIVLAIGMLAGGVVISVKPFFKKPWKKISIPYFLFAVGYILTAIHGVIFITIGLFIMGFFLAIGNVTTLAFFQKYSAAQDNADIMAYVSFISMAGTPIAMALAGILLGRISAHALIFIYALSSLISSSLVLLFKEYRELK